MKKVITNFKDERKDDLTMLAQAVAEHEFLNKSGSSSSIPSSMNHSVIKSKRSFFETFMKISNENNMKKQKVETNATEGHSRSSKRGKFLSHSVNKHIIAKYYEIKQSLLNL